MAAPIDDAITKHEYAAALVKAKDERRLVLLLDGLNEVPRERRPMILEAVDKAVKDGAVVVIASRTRSTNADELAPKGFRFFSLMPLRAEDIADRVGDASPMAEYVETHLELSLAMNAYERGEAPETRASLYTLSLIHI